MTFSSLSCPTLRGFGTERARLGTFRGFGTERARLGTFRGLVTERARLGPFRGLGTERARLGPFRGLGTKSQKNVIFLLKKSTQPPLKPYHSFIHSFIVPCLHPGFESKLHQ